MADTFQEILGKIKSGETSLFCSKHFYTPSRVSKPGKGCADCWRAFYWTLYAKTPDNDREDFVEGLEMTLKHMVEHIEGGTWDFVPNFSAEITKETN